MKKSVEKRKTNPFDIIVIILVICLLCVFGYRMYVGVAEEAHNNDIKYVMEFECENEYDSMLEYLAEGDAVYFADDGKLLGYLYAGPDSENGAVYVIIDDIPTFAGAGELDLPDVSQEKETGSGAESTEESEHESETVSEKVRGELERGSESKIYRKIKIGGTLRLNIVTARVKSGNYYSIGGRNFVEGSVIDVYTDRVEFTIKVSNISIVEE